LSVVLLAWLVLATGHTIRRVLLIGACKWYNSHAQPHNELTLTLTVPVRSSPADHVVLSAEQSRRFV